ncbi:MAG: caspase family protein [Spirochaetes bacterium]|uniref:Caspase family protein n=1 Tax=Candidatus Ornithospirochaeta stercoripullorum TaxID=2840899 RepID=A0A9D9H4Y9_9SPIO|nr:caspase family protein [Candidatus Ornithospirochaeta stercoripullorum]
MLRILLMAIAVLLTSCEVPRGESKVIFISAALDYGAPESVNALDNPPEDQRVLSEQIEALAEASGDVYEEYLFLEKNGTRTLNGVEMNWNHDDIIRVLYAIDTISSDLIIFHYSGHGDDDGNLVTDIDTEYRLSPALLLETMENIDGKKCIFLDSCFSGKFVEEIGYMHEGEVYKNGMLSSENLINALGPSLAISISGGNSRENGIWVLSAASESQSSFDKWESGEVRQEDFGAFSYYLATALGYDMEEDRPSLPPEGSRITFYSLFQEIKEEMDKELWMRATPQKTLSEYDIELFTI